MSQECKCGRRLHGTTICNHCVTTLETCLVSIADHYRDLETLRTKRARFGGSATKGSLGRTIPLPIDPRFVDPTGIGSEVDFGVRAEMVAWAKVVLEDHPPLAGPACRHCKHATCASIKRRRHPADNVPSVAHYLAGMAPSLIAETWVEDMLDEMLDTEKRIARLLDRPTTRWYAGICGTVIEAPRPHDGRSCACGCHNGADYPCDVPGGCGSEQAEVDGVTCTARLSAEPDDPFVRCRECGVTYTVADRRPVVLAEMRKQAAPVETIVQAALTLTRQSEGAAVLAARIRQWASRGAIIKVGERTVRGRPRPTYQVGVVLDLLNPDTPEDEQRAG